jgi:glutamyl-tRNA reductase
MPGGIDFLVMGLSHRTAPLAVRERLAVAPEQMSGAIQQLGSLPEVREVALLSTCNRVEVYAVSPDLDAAIAALQRDFAARAGTTEAELTPHLYVRVDVEAVHHLFRVASSLDSLMVGEPQILGQVKQAHDSALAARAVGPVLGACFSGAFRIARRIRRETEIARNSVSISSVAIEYARRIFDGFEGRTVLLIGAGKMADLAGRALGGQGARLVVTNRTPARADELARRVGGTTVSFEGLEGALVDADIVISSTGARQPILTRELLLRIRKRRRGRPLFLVDIAVPRDVEPGCGDISGIFAVDIDDLQKLANEHREERRGEADRGRRVGPVITALRSRVLDLARGEAERGLLRELAHLAERDRHAVLGIAEAIAKKVLHGPQVALKKGGADAVEGAALIAAVQRLFELPLGEEGPAGTGTSAEMIGGMDGGPEAARKPEAAQGAEVAPSLDATDVAESVGVGRVAGVPSNLLSRQGKES